MDGISLSWLAVRVELPRQQPPGRVARLYAHALCFPLLEALIGWLAG